MSKPETVFKMGAVRASIFRNTIERDGKLVSLAKVIIEVRYKDRTGKWQGTNSLSINEVPKAMLALQKAYEYLVSSDSEETRPEPEFVPASSPNWRRKP